MIRNKKLFSLVIALAFVFSAMGLAFAPSSAVAAVAGHYSGQTATNNGEYLEGDAIPPTTSPDCSTYLVGEPTTDEISVTLVIEAGNAFNSSGLPVLGTALRKELPVTLTGNNAKTVTSVLVALNQTNGLTFYQSGNTQINSSSNYLGKVTMSGDYSATWTAGTLFGFDGWVFRVNDKYPVQLTSDGLGYEGTSILQTPVYDGDVVHFFYDYPSDYPYEDVNIAANYVRAVHKSFNSTTHTLEVQLQGHRTYIDPSSYIMYVYNYVNLGSGLVANLYKEDGTLVQRRQPSSFDGVVTFTDNNDLLSGGTYIVHTVPEYEYNEDWDIDATLFTLTGSYSVITLP
jgi:hypothetical protein